MKELSAEIAAAFEDDAVKFADLDIELHFTLPTLLTVIAQMQLAQRHPGNNGQSAHLARRVIERLIERVSFTPAIRAVLEAGNDTEYDKPKSRPRLELDNPN